MQKNETHDKFQKNARVCVRVRNIFHANINKIMSSKNFDFVPPYFVRFIGKRVDTF